MTFLARNIMKEGLLVVVIVIVIFLLVLWPGKESAVFARRPNIVPGRVQYFVPPRIPGPVRVPTAPLPAAVPNRGPTVVTRPPQSAPGPFVTVGPAPAPAPTPTPTLPRPNTQTEYTLLDSAILLNQYLNKPKPPSSGSAVTSWV